jgi:VWFA-related protein
MRRFPRLLMAAVALTTTAYAQTPQQAPTQQAPAQQAPAPQPNAQTAVIHVSTELVVVDVVVQDKDGHPVHGLKPEDFHLTEGKVPQNLRHFEEHSALAPDQQGPPLPKMPPGTFTDYTPVPPGGALNILLLDALNTPMKDQSFVRNQLQQYVNHAPAGTRIAIFGLANRLIMLQGFTSDPETLKNVVDHKLIPRGSSLLDDPTGSGVDQMQPSDMVDPNAPGMAQLAANLQQFEAETASMQTQLRVQYTLDAFNSLGHYLSAFPGRKNLIWFSGSFPINVLPDPTLPNPFAVVQVDQDEFRDTTSLLSKAQVSVYPVDARGLMSQPVFDAANSGRSTVGSPAKFTASLNKFSNSQASEHGTMDQLASETGGQAFYDTNNLVAAVTKAITAGANYYTLAYDPTNRKQDGAYRDIRINLTGSQAASNLQLSYRHGYYAGDADTHHKDSETATTTGPPPTAPTTAQGAATAYVHAAMSRGAPTPEDILFKVRVLPASTTTEDSVAPDNKLDPSVSPKGPFRRYDVDYVSLPSAFKLTQQPDGRRSGQVEFLALVFDVDGRMLASTGKAITLNLTPETYNQFMHSAISCHLEVSVPTSQETFIRIGVRDIPSNKLGVVEVPTSSVSHLAPAVYQTAPASPAKPSTAPPTPAQTPAPPPAASPAPSTPPPS